MKRNKVVPAPVIFITSDNEVFYEKHDAIKHTNKLSDKTISIISANEAEKLLDTIDDYGELEEIAY